MVWFGLISFPLYLWHWPLLSFARIMESETPSNKVRIAAVLLSIFLAWLTYWLIEKPFRFGGNSGVKAIALIVLMVLVGNAGFYSYKQDGLPHRNYAAKFQSYTESIVGDPRQSECFEIRFAFERKDNWFCNLGDKTIHPSFFAFGDSHALNQMPALEKFAHDYKLNILFTGSSGCPPLLGVQSMRGVAWTDQYNCQKLNERIFSYVKETGIKSVLLMARWSYYIGGTTRPAELNPISMDITKESTKEFSKLSFDYGLKQTIDRFKSIGVQVYLFDDTPQQLYDPKDALKKSRTPADIAINQLSVSAAEHKNNQSEVSDKFKSLKNQVAGIVNFDDALCNQDICPLVSNGKFIYLDDDHLTVDGAMLDYPNITKVLSLAALDTQQKFQVSQ